MYLNLPVLFLSLPFYLPPSLLSPPPVSLSLSLPLSLQYGIVIDAGSTYTNFYLYQWTLPKPDNGSTGRVVQTDSCPICESVDITQNTLYCT